MRFEVTSDDHTAVRGSTEQKCVQWEGTFRRFFHVLLSHFGEHGEELQAMLIESGEQPIFMREERGAEHAAALKAFLKILEADGWLADFFFAGLLEMWAEKTPTPLNVMQSLTEPAFNFECDINDAKRLMQDWPNFFPAQAATAKPHDMNGANGMVEAKPSDDNTGYVLNEFDATGKLARAIWMSRGQYGEVKKTLLEQGCEVVDEKAKATADGKE